MKKVALLWLMFGLVYYPMEGLFHIVTTGGWAWIGMAVIGGLCGLLIGRINQIRAFYDKPMWFQCLIGTAVILAVEFASGELVNRALGWGIWDYSRLPLNLDGQICLPFAVIWFFLVPLVIWLEDIFRYRWWGEKDAFDYYHIINKVKPAAFGSPVCIYRELFHGL